MSRLNSATDIDELSEILQSAIDGEFIEFRPRTSGSERAWIEVPGLQSHLWNTEKFNYRLGEAPALRVVGNHVEDADGHYILVADAKKIFALAKRCERSGEGKDDYGTVRGDDRDSYRITIDRDGSVTVGCEVFDLADIEDLAKRSGW